MDFYTWKSEQLARFIEIGFRDTRYRFRIYMAKNFGFLDQVQQEEIVQDLMEELSQVTEHMVIVALNQGKLNPKTLKQTRKSGDNVRSIILTEEDS